MSMMLPAAETMPMMLLTDTGDVAVVATRVTAFEPGALLYHCCSGNDSGDAARSRDSADETTY